MEYLDLAEVENGNVNQLIKQKLKIDDELTLCNVKAMHNICAGLQGSGNITIEDSTGLYTGSFLEGITVRVKGSAGWYAGDDMMSGELIIEKNTGCNIGAYINGGTIVVYGNTGSRVGYGMKGGSIIICGNAGAWAGIMAMGGDLIILGNVGEKIGESMYSGKIFTRDTEVDKKIGDNVYLDGINNDEIIELEKLFNKYNIDAKADEFRVIRPMKTGRHEYNLFKPQLKPQLAKKFQVKRG